MKTQLSVWSAYYRSLSPEDAVREFKKHGIHAAELSTEHAGALLRRGDAATVGREFAQFLAEENFTMTQGHLWLGCEYCSYKDHFDGLLDWIVLFDAVGAKNAVLHVDKLAAESELTQEQRYDRNVEKLSEIAAFIKQKGLAVRICLENLIQFGADIDSINNMLDRLDPDVFGICLDTGHLNLTDGDQRSFILKAGKRLHALHIADNQGRSDQHMMPFGRGIVNFKEVVETLQEINYEGLFNLEIPGENLAPIPVLGYKLEYIKKCYDYMMSEWIR